MFEVICETAPFCLSREYVAASETTGFAIRVDEYGREVVASQRAINALGVRIQFVANDQRTDLEADVLRETCVDDACVIFRTSCAEFSCSWWAAPLIDGQTANLEEIRLIASTAESLETAKNNVFITVPTSQGEQRISLHQLGGGEPARTGQYSGPPIGDWD